MSCKNPTAQAYRQCASSICLPRFIQVRHLLIPRIKVLRPLSLAFVCAHSSSPLFSSAQAYQVLDLVFSSSSICVSPSRPRSLRTEAPPEKSFPNIYDQVLELVSFIISVHYFEILLSSYKADHVSAFVVFTHSYPSKSNDVLLILILYKKP